jgi:hypothetical protein
MIVDYAKNGPPFESLKLFFQMKQIYFQLEQFTLTSVLPTCSDMASFKHGVEIHKEIIRNMF